MALGGSSHNTDCPGSASQSQQVPSDWSSSTIPLSLIRGRIDPGVKFPRRFSRRANVIDLVELQPTLGNSLYAGPVTRRLIPRHRPSTDPSKSGDT